MASAPSFAQHYIECENCEENAAKYLCKTCIGHICESCKSEHERRKISQNHDIVHITSEKGDMLELLHCSEHRNEKLKCYCSPCRTPVCTQCIMGRHNGHKVQNMATVYNTIKDELLKEKDEIETILLPKYEELLAKENEKKTAVSERTDEVRRQIEDHTESLIERLTDVKQKRVEVLQQEEKKALESVANSETEIRRRIKTLNEIKTQISKNLGTKPGIIFFRATNDNSLKEMRRIPIRLNTNSVTFLPVKLKKEYGI